MVIIAGINEQKKRVDKGFRRKSSQITHLVENFQNEKILRKVAWFEDDIKSQNAKSLIYEQTDIQYTIIDSKFQHTTSSRARMFYPLRSPSFLSAKL